MEWTSAGQAEGDDAACPPGVAQWLHDEVVQRLCSVAAALGSDGILSGADQARCGSELEGALDALKTLLNDAVGQARQHHFGTVAEAVRAHCVVPGGPAVELRIMGDVEVVAATGQFVADFVAEVVRNAVKHAHARSILLTVTVADGAVRVHAFNDGVLTAPGSVGAGVGLQLLAARAREHGGFVSSCPSEPGGWSTTLTLVQRQSPPAGDRAASVSLNR